MLQAVSQNGGMSTGLDPILSAFPTPAPAEAVALGNPPDRFRSWTLVHPPRQRLSSFYVEDCWPSDEEDAQPDSGYTSFLIDEDPHVFGSGAAVTISYERNTEVLECVENTALNGINSGLARATITQILDSVQTTPGWRTYVELRTLPDGSLDLPARPGPFYPDAAVLSNPVPLPSVLLSSLRCTHQLGFTPNIFLVETALDPPFDNVQVFKTATSRSNLVREVEFMTSLPCVDFLLRPTHVVLDEAGLLHGHLSRHHPASSLCLTMEFLHPGAEQPVLPPLGLNRSGWSLAGSTTSVTWPVRLAWAIDVAASVAWLHEHAIVWGDLKTDNIILCMDGHCRLIDYYPGGQTINWCAPEVQQDDWVASPAGDVFALGLVLWAIAVEVATFEREQDYVSPLLSWSKETPGWFQDVAASCLQHTPLDRPSALHVCNILRQHLYA